MLWCDKMYKNISKKLLHLTIEFFYIFYFEIYMEFICLLSVYLYVKRYFRGKPQTSFGILISIGDTSRKEKRRYAICSAAFFIIDILCKFVYRRISAIFQFLVHHF